MPAETDAAMLDRLTGLAAKATPGKRQWARFEQRMENADGDRKEIWWTEFDEMFSTACDPDTIRRLIALARRGMEWDKALADSEDDIREGRLTDHEDVKKELL